ncbi:flavodoxin family protein [Microbacterium insulae]|uniref:Flavodoxin family protein n=1 Tax=Microbacterium insulae TaxID=483014 RepID=A0ABW3AF43_9MICO
MSDAETGAPKVALVYESMFGGTRRIAEAIAEGMRAFHPVTVVPVEEAKRLPDDIDVLVVGAPTHAHSLSRPESRAEAVQWARDERKDLHLDGVWSDLGIREWLKDFSPQVAHHAAFDTRADMPRIFAGSAAAAIDRRLTKLGSKRVIEPESFFVDRESHLEAGQVERARAWGMQLAAQLLPSPAR